jgi:hypothetical protein
MSVGLGRLFLFLLLVCDWAGDPYFGHSPLSRPGSSQDVYCYSLYCRHFVRLAVVPSGVDNHITAASPDCFLAPASASAIHPLPADSPHLPSRAGAPTPLRC